MCICIHESLSIYLSLYIYIYIYIAPLEALGLTWVASVVSAGAFAGMVHILCLI